MIIILFTHFRGLPGHYGNILGNVCLAANFKRAFDMALPNVIREINTTLNLLYVRYSEFMLLKIKE